MQRNFGMATVAGFLVLFLLGYALYGMALAGFFEANGGGATDAARLPPTIWAIAAGQLVFAVFLTMALGWKGVTDAGGGAKTAAVIGFLVALSYDLVLFGSTRLMNATGMVADVVVFAAISAIAGAAVGAVMNRGQEPVPA